MREFSGAASFKSRMPKKAADKKFQIQNSLVPVFCNLFGNRFKQRQKQAKTVVQTATETMGNGDRRKRT